MYKNGYGIKYKVTGHKTKPHQTKDSNEDYHLYHFYDP